MKDYNYYIYIMASISGTLYIGMTNDLGRRLYEHREELVDGFSKKYNCKKLVYYEHFANVIDCIAREKQLKKWSRRKKEWLIQTINPEWKDLGEEF